MEKLLIELTDKNINSGLFLLSDHLSLRLLRRPLLARPQSADGMEQLSDDGMPEVSIDPSPRETDEGIGLFLISYSVATESSLPEFQ